MDCSGSEAEAIRDSEGLTGSVDQEIDYYWTENFFFWTLGNLLLLGSRISRNPLAPPEFNGAILVLKSSHPLRGRSIMDELSFYSLKTSLLGKPESLSFL